MLAALVAVVAMAVVGAAVVTVSQNLDSDLTAGQCVSSDDDAAFDLQPTDCGDTNAVYEFAGKADVGICPDGKRAQDGSYFIFKKTSTEQLCFALNLHKGDCYLMDLSEKTVSHVACADAPSRANATTGAMKVSDRIDGTSDTTRCRADTKPLAYNQPERLYCLEKAVDS